MTSLDVSSARDTALAKQGALHLNQGPRLLPQVVYQLPTRSVAARWQPGQAKHTMHQVTLIEPM